MIGKDSTQVFGIVPKTMKRQMAVLRRTHKQWSESRMIREGLKLIMPVIESEPLSPTHDTPRRK